MKKKQIWEIADIVRQQLSLECPVDINSLCHATEQLGGICVPVSDGQISAEAKITTPSDTDCQEYRFKIEYADNKPETRKLFSIAHELGHLFLHILQANGKLVMKTEYERNFDSSAFEIEANEFAAALLMPEDEFIKKCIELLDKDSKVSVSELARFFNVSVQAATVRGSILGLW